MKSNRSENRLTKTGTRLLITIVFVAVAGVTLLFVLAREQWLALNEQELKDQQSIMVPAELVNMKIREDSILNSSELLDSASGTYRIPIEQAMKLIESEAGN